MRLVGGDDDQYLINRLVRTYDWSDNSTHLIGRRWNPNPTPPDVSTLAGEIAKAFDLTTPPTITWSPKSNEIMLDKAIAANQSAIAALMDAGLRTVIESHALSSIISIKDNFPKRSAGLLSEDAIQNNPLDYMKPLGSDPERRTAIIEILRTSYTWTIEGDKLTAQWKKAGETPINPDSLRNRLIIDLALLGCTPSTSSDGAMLTFKDKGLEEVLRKAGVEIRQIGPKAPPRNPHYTSF